MPRTLSVRSLFLCLLASTAALADAETFAARRRAVLEKAGDGIVLLHSNSGLKRWEEAGYLQDPAFLYFTGLRNAQGAILALDGPGKASWLFLRKPGADAESKIDHVVSWDELVPWLEERRKTLGKLVLYADDGGQTGAQMGDGGNPPGLAPVSNPYLLFTSSLKARFGDAEIRPAFRLLDEIRQIKSPGEIAALRKAAEITADGFWAAARTIAPGRTQRQIEGEVLRACFAAGSTGISLWPWIRSGPMASGSKLFAPFSDWNNLDREMKSGELVRVDLGCDFDSYKGDLGRTVPVSGKFSESQRETLDLLTGAYLAGLDRIREGASRRDLINAGEAFVKSKQETLKTASAKKAAAQMLEKGFWPLHGLGLDMAEGTPKSFRAGNVLCYEPIVEVDGDAYFVEDTILVTQTGHELLNPPLPYRASDLEKEIARRKR